MRRVIPWEDVTGDAVRLAENGDVIAREIGDDFPVEFIRCATVVFEIAGEGGDIGIGGALWFASVAGFDGGEFGCALSNQNAEVGEQAAAIKRGSFAPGPFIKSLAGGADG